MGFPDARYTVPVVGGIMLLLQYLPPPPKVGKTAHPCCGGCKTSTGDLHFSINHVNPSEDSCSLSLNCVCVEVQDRHTDTHTRSSAKDAQRTLTFRSSMCTGDVHACGRELTLRGRESGAADGRGTGAPGERRREESKKCREQHVCSHSKSSALILIKCACDGFPAARSRRNLLC